jgi:N-acetylmuramoyl-L-alanine amidase
MNIRKDLLTVNQFSRPGKKLVGVKALVIHWVANAGSTAQQNRAYFESLKAQDPNRDQKILRWASAHFIVGITGEVVQCIPCEEMAYHVGATSYTPQALRCLGSYPNNCTIGIELCHPSADGKFGSVTLMAAAELCALLCIQFDLDPIDDTWTHHAVTGKNCPKWFIDYPEEFARFKAQTRVVLNSLRR